MDRRTTLAIVLSFLIFMGWQKFYIEPRMAKPGVTAVSQNTPTTTTTQTEGASSTQTLSQGKSGGSTSATTPKTVAPEEKTFPVSVGETVVSNGKKIFSDWNLREYRRGISAEASKVDLFSVVQQNGEGEIAFDSEEFAYINGVSGVFSSTPKGVMWTYEDSLIKLTREISTDSSQPYADLTVRADFKTDKRPKYMFLSVSMASPEGDPEVHDRNLIYHTNQSTEWLHVEKANEIKQVVTPVKWVAAANRYFIFTLVNQSGYEPKGLVQPIAQTALTDPKLRVRISLVYPLSESSMRIPLRAYFGPKDLSVLPVVDQTLNTTVDFGWFTLIAYPLLKIMRWFYGIFHNYGVAIILLTVLVKLVTFPLTYKSMKSMKQMARLQPQLQQLRDRYKDDKEALNREMLTFMRTHGYNPMSGCLPILIQMPVFFALYRVLYSSIELYHAPFAFWIHDLASKDQFYVTPVLLSVTMFIQQKMTPTTATDPAQQKMMQFMPLIFGAFMLTLPSGLTLYMLTNALTSILQQAALNRKFADGNPVVLPARG